MIEVLDDDAIDTDPFLAKVGTFTSTTFLAAFGGRPGFPGRLKPETATCQYYSRKGSRIVTKVT